MEIVMATHVKITFLGNAETHHNTGTLEARIEPGTDFIGITALDKDTNKFVVVRFPKNELRQWARGLLAAISSDEAVSEKAAETNVEPPTDNKAAAAKDWRDTNISDEFRLPIRVRRCLIGQGLKTIGEATKYSDAEYLGVPGFGNGSLQYLRRYLDERQNEDTAYDPK
jgi:hypothetical protein